MVSVFCTVLHTGTVTYSTVQTQRMTKFRIEMFGLFVLVIFAFGIFGAQERERERKTTSRC